VVDIQALVEQDIAASKDQ